MYRIRRACCHSYLVVMLLSVGLIVGCGTSDPPDPPSDTVPGGSATPIATEQRVAVEHAEDEHADDEHADDEHADDEHAADEHADEHDVLHLAPERLETLDISLAIVHAGSVSGTLALPAETMLDPDGEAHLVPRVPGIVREVFFGIGDKVKAGDLLAVLESLELGKTKSEYLAALGLRDLARATFEREKRLWEEDISAEQDYLTAEQAYRAAELAVNTAEQALYALGLSAEEVAQLPAAKETTLTHFEIRAPFDATILERHISTGEAVSPESEIFFIAKLDPLWVMGRVTERDIRRVSLGQEAIIQLDAYPNQEFTGNVDYIGSILDPESRTLNVRVVLPNPDGDLRARMFGRMFLFLDRHDHADTLIVPNTALQRTATGAIVYKQLGEGEFTPVPVSVLHASDLMTEVQGELAEGDRVAAGDIFVLKSEAGKAQMGGGHSH